MSQKKTAKAKKTDNYRVFAIYAEVPEDDPIVYVGKSRMKELKTLLRYYRNGSEITKEFFAPGVTPEIFWLEEAVPKNSVYCYCIAWSRYFLEKNVDLIANWKQYEDAWDLYGVAQEIYAGIADLTLYEVLQRKYWCTNPSKENADKQMPHEPISERLSIRLTRRENDAFSEFCKNNRATQRQAIQLLLSRQSECSPVAFTVIQEQIQEIERLKNENKKLMRVPRGVSADKNLKEAFYFVQTAVRKYFCMYKDTTSLQGEKLKCQSWNYFVNDFPNYRAYKYPTGNEYFRFELEAMCYGKGKRAAIFLYGINCETKELTKLRFYQRRDYCGVIPPHDAFYVRGMRFFVGCRLLYDDVADMVCAFPMVEPDEAMSDGVLQIYDEDCLGEVDKLIEDAELRSGY